jgi:hypothetical protein
VQITSWEGMKVLGNEGEISGSHGGNYEDSCILTCCAASLFEIDRRFRGAYRFHHQGDSSSN